MKYFILFILVLFSLTSLANSSDLNLSTHKPVYNFIIPSSYEGESFNFFNDCSDSTGLVANSNDEARHINLIYQDGTTTAVPLNKSRPNSN